MTVEHPDESEILFLVGVEGFEVDIGIVVQARDRRGDLLLCNFSVFEEAVVFFICLDAAETGYVLTWLETRAGAFVGALVSIVVLATTIAAKIESTATVFLFLRKLREFLDSLLGAWL